jgi:hypothetical protein
MRVKGKLLALAAAGVVGLSLMTSPAEAQRRWGGGWGGGGWGGGWRGAGWRGGGWGRGWGGFGVGSAVGLGIGLAASSAWGYPSYGYGGWGGGWGYPSYGYASYPGYGYYGYASYPGGWGGSCLRQVWWRGGWRWRNYC